MSNLEVLFSSNKYTIKRLSYRKIVVESYVDIYIDATSNRGSILLETIKLKAIFFTKNTKVYKLSYKSHRNLLIKMNRRWLKLKSCIRKDSIHFSYHDSVFEIDGINITIDVIDRVNIVNISTENTHDIILKKLRDNKLKDILCL